MSHRCHAHGCRVEVAPRMLFCKPHWFSTRRALQEAIWREYRPGQERDKNASERYLAVQQLCVSELLHKRTCGLPSSTASMLAAEYAERAEKHRERAIADGAGDPFESLERRPKKPEPQLSLFGGSCSGGKP